MQAVLHSLVAGLPLLLLHLFVATLVFVVAAIIYLKITPHDELELIRENNVAAAISLGAALLGLAIPLAFCLHGSVNVLDILLWGSVILTLQVIAYLAVDRVLKGLSERIESDQRAAACFLAAIKLSAACLNAAAIAA